MIRLIIQIGLMVILCVSLVKLTSVLNHMLKTPAKSKSFTVGDAGTSEIVRKNGLQKIEKQPISSFLHTLSKPIFFPDRTLPVKKTSPETAVVAGTRQATKHAEISTSKYKLIGLLIDGAIKRALIETPNSRQSWYFEGMKINNWTVFQISRNTVLLKHGEREASLTLYKPTKHN